MMTINPITKHPIVSGVTTAGVVAIFGWIFSVGGFVTAEAYANDQGKLDQIISLIQTTDANQTYTRKREALDATITDTEQRVEELELYLEADPDSKVAGARRANIRRLSNLKLEAEREKKALDEMTARQNSSGGT